MTFTSGILFAIATLAIASYAAFTGVHLDVLPLSDSPLVYGWGAGVVALLATAILSRRNAKARFESIVASEVIVVYGITTLVLSIGLGVSRTADVWEGAAGPPPLDQLVPAMRVFAEGFVAAGVSPFCAVALRQIDVLTRGPDYEGPSEARRGEVVGAAPTAPADQLSSAVISATAAANSFASSMRGAARNVEHASELMAIALEAVGKGGERARSGLDAVSDSAASVAGRFKPTAQELAKLGASAKEGALLLDGLREIISAVEQFVPRGRTGRDAR